MRRTPSITVAPSSFPRGQCSIINDDGERLTVITLGPALCEEVARRMIAVAAEVRSAGDAARRGE